MKQTIVFSEIENENSYRTAIAFSEQADCVVYVLHKAGERPIDAEHINLIEVEQRRQDKLADAMKRIEADQGSIDMLVLSAGKHCAQDGKITDGHNYEELLAVIDENVVGTLEVVKSALELMRKGCGKRIALLTERASSINLNRDEQDYGYLMSLAALNMMEKIWFNTLRPEGFTFRCYAAEGDGGMSPQAYLLSKLNYIEKDDYIHSDENRIVMRDKMLCELPW